MLRFSMENQTRLVGQDVGPPHPAVQHPQPHVNPPVPQHTLQSQGLEPIKSDPPKPDSSKSGKTMFIVGIALIALVILGGAAYFALHKTSKTPLASSSSTKPVVTTLPQNKANAERQNDAAEILSALNEYTSNNNGLLPTSATSVGAHSLELCGTNCSNAASVNLSYYLASNVTFKPYSPNLEVINADQLYLVDGASCASSSSIGGQTSPRDAVAIFGIEQSDGIGHLCQSF